MLLAQGRFWRASMEEGGDRVTVAPQRDSLPDDFKGLRDLRVDIPLETWNRVMKHARTDRKLLGGVVLDHVKEKDHLATALASDRLFGELQRVLLDATASLVEMGVLVLATAEPGND
jgi:hypothetical protein